MTANDQFPLLPLYVRLVSAAELERRLPAFVALLRETVNGGASLGFLPPLSVDDAWKYWRSLVPALRVGSRLLFAIYSAEDLVGSGQLVLVPWPNARHRADVQKVFVAKALNGRGVGRALMEAIHDVARHRGRSLLLLNTRRGGPAEPFYKRLGYREVGVIPGYAVDAAGAAYDSLALYRSLRPETEAGET